MWGGGGSFYKKEKMVFGDAWKERWFLVMHGKKPIFSFSRMNILFFFLLYD